MADRSRAYDRMPGALVALLAVFLAAGLAAARLVPGPPPEAAPLPDLSAAHLAEVRNASGVTVLSGEFRERTDDLGGTERDAALYDRRGRRVIGEIEIEMPSPSSLAPTQELEIDIIGLDASAKYSLFVDDREVTAFSTDDRGSIDIEIHSLPPAGAPSR